MFHIEKSKFVITNKSDILNWLEKNKIQYAIDASNESATYLRNRIRSAVLPALTQCDERWNNNFSTTLNRLKQDNALLNDIALTRLNSLVSQEDNSFNILQFLAIHSSLHHRIIIHWLIHNSVQFPTTQKFLDEIIRFLLQCNGGTHSIHRQWSITKKQNKAFIIKCT